ncbi:MAG: hypothetical protein KDJ90_13535 [Nitratireductor sp.]|nr:hypothetical protein [Nitratireductor sp.]
MSHDLRLVSFDMGRTLGIDGVRYLKPGLFLRETAALREADWVLFPEEWQLGVLTDALKCRVFPSIQSYRYGQDKIQFTRALQALSPEHLPDTLIERAEPETALRVAEHFGFPFVVKTPRSSMGQGVFRVESRRDLMGLLPGLDVLYAQQFLDIERDLRVVWIGDRVVCAYWREGGDGFHHNVARGGALNFDGVPGEALDLVHDAATGLGINHGGFDLAFADGQWFFLEVNVRFGNAGLKAAGIDPAASILDWLKRNTPDRNDPSGPREPPVALAG